MDEWVSGSGAFSVFLLNSIIIGFSWLVGWCLRILIAPPRPPTAPTEIGRSWAGWAVFASSFSSLPKFFATFDIFSLAEWLLGAVPVAISAFVLGWGYGKRYKVSNQTRTRLSVAPLVADDSIGAPATELTWMHGEGLAFCEAFIGKSGLRYYLSKFEHFAQREPKPTERSMCFRSTNTPSSTSSQTGTGLPFYSPMVGRFIETYMGGPLRASCFQLYVSWQLKKGRPDWDLFLCLLHMLLLAYMPTPYTTPRLKD